MRWTASALLLVLHVLTAWTLGAQQLRGTVLQPDGATPASGVVALLVSSRTDSVVARSVTALSGQFMLMAPNAGPFTLRLLRVGHRPQVRGPFDLRDGETRVDRVVLADQPVVLAQFNVRARDQCRTRPDSGLLVAQLLQEARTALFASVSANSDGDSWAEYRVFTRLEDTKRRLLAPEQNVEVTRFTARPFASLSPDSIARVGYVASDGDSVLYRGPDAEVLLSDAFAAQHCFQVVIGAGARAASIGVAFRPVARRRGVVDIRGTIWMHRETSMLESVEFTYDPLPDEAQRADVGGDVQFMRSEAGLWFVKRWTVVMPRISVRRIAARLAPRPAPSRTIRVVEGLQVDGGEVAALFVGDVAHYVNEKASGSTNAITPATPVAAMQQHLVCGAIGAGIDSGAVQGRIVAAPALAVANVRVVAEWRDSFTPVGASMITFRNHSREGVSVADGTFVLCDVPINVPLQIVAVRDGRRTRPIDVRLSLDEPVVTVDVPLTDAMIAALTDSLRIAQDAIRRTAKRLADDSARVRTAAAQSARQTATLRLRVRGERDLSVADAEVVVRIGDVTRSTRTDSTGNARVESLPSGFVDVSVRQIGLAPANLRLRIEAGDNSLSMQLRGSTVTLDAMRIIGNREASGRYAEIDARIRRKEANSVITRADLDFVRPIALSQMLRRVTGLRISDSLGVKKAMSLRGPKPTADGTPRPCQLRVMVDEIIMPQDVDLDAVMPTDVHAIEIFNGPSRIPPQYAGIRTDAWCGLIAIWTRVK